MAGKILSISIAAYNVSIFIRKALDSLILESSYMERLEVIIVNDGSTDDTLSIAAKYQKQYPNTFRVIDKENGGYGSTINESLKVAEGKYYKLLDGDDWYDKSGLRGLIDFLGKTDADLVISPYYLIRSVEELVPHHADVPKEEVEIKSLHLKDKLFQMHGMTIKTGILRRYNHQIAKHCFYTDIEFVFYCLVASETISRFEKPVYNYRMNVSGQSVSLDGIQKHYKDHSMVTERICKCYENECLGFTGGKKEVIDYAVTFSIYGMFNNYMVLKDARKHKKELIIFDNHLMDKHPRAYKTGNDSNVVRITRRLGFHLYWLVCQYMKYKFGRF